MDEPVFKCTPANSLEGDVKDYAEAMRSVRRELDEAKSRVEELINKEVAATREYHSACTRLIRSADPEYGKDW